MNSFKWNPHKDCDRFPCCCWWMATQVRWRAEKIEFLEQHRQELLEIQRHPFKYGFKILVLDILLPFRLLFRKVKYASRICKARFSRLFISS